MEISYPLCIVSDRYDGAYSDGKFLAFNLSASFVGHMPIDADDVECEQFWNNAHEFYNAKDYPIGKGETVDEALKDLKRQLADRNRH